MAYSSGMLNKRIRIAKRAEEQGSSFGKSGQPQYSWLGWFWANESFSKGVKALQEGALDAYATSMDDIIVSCLLSQKGIARYVIEHLSGSVTLKEHKASDNYVYDQYKYNDSAQVAYLNSHLKR